MAKAIQGRKYRLLFYGYMLNRWRRATLFLGITILVYVGILWGAEWYYIDPAKNPLVRLDTLSGSLLIGLGAIVVLFSIFLALAHRWAYIQPMGDHFKIVTPFFRVNVSYRRIHSTRTAEFGSLFPPKKMSNYKGELVEPFARDTAIVVQLTGFPISPKTLRLFLSPFFFYDNTPHFVLLVDDWMRFSSELESYRISGKNAQNPSVVIKPQANQPQAKQPQAPKPRSGMLAALPKDDKKK